MVQCKQEYALPNLNRDISFHFSSFLERSSAYSWISNDLTKKIKYRPYEGVRIKAREIQTSNISKYPL